MDFWKRLNGASSLTLAATLATAAPRSRWTRRRADYAFAAVAAVARRRAVVSTAGLAALTLFGERLVGDHTLVERYRAGLVVANVVWVAGLVSATGGVEHPYWALMTAPLLIAAVSMTRIRSLLIGIVATLSLLIAAMAAGPLHRNGTSASWCSSCRSARASPGSSACSAPPSGTSAAPPPRSATT